MNLKNGKNYPVNKRPAPIERLPRLNAGLIRPSFNPIPPGGEERGAESARTDFNFREVPWYLSNTYQM